MKNKNQKKRMSLNLVFSVLIAIIGWTYVVYDVAPTVDRTFRNVPIEYIGEGDIAEEGLGVLDSSCQVIDITVSTKRTSFNKNTAEDISVTVDVSDVKKGENTLPINIALPNGLSLKNQTEDSVIVNVSESSNKDVGVLVDYASGVAENQEPMALNLSYDKASVIGAKKNVEKVAHVVLPVNPEDVDASPKDFTLKPIAVDKSGNIVPHIVIFPSEIYAMVVKSTVKEVGLNLTVVDESSDGRSRTYKCPDTIMIKGDKSVLANIKEVNASCDVTGVYDSGRYEIDFNLPDGVSLANKSAGTHLKLTVK